MLRLKLKNKIMTTTMNNTATIKDAQGTIHSINNLKKEFTTDFWFEIPNYPNYLISQRGLLKRVAYQITHKDGKTHNMQEFITKGSITGGGSNGYHRARLVNEYGHKYKYIHKIMGEVFYNHKSNKDFPIDHVNTDSHNNNLYNLQVITHRENVSKDKHTGYTSKYVGVSRAKPTHSWRAAITINKEVYSLGTYEDEVEASHAYQTALNDWLEYEITPKQRKAFDNIKKVA